MSAVALADVRAFLNITSNAQDAELQDTVDRAEAILERRVGPLTLVSVVDEIHTGPGPLVLRRFPVASVTSVTTDGLAYTNVDVDPESGVIYGRFSLLPRSVRVSYLAGRSPLPSDLEAAVLELVGHLWRSQRGISPSRMAAEADGDTAGYLLPYRVQSLIERHLLPPVVA